MRAAVERFSRVDALVNNAGISLISPAEDTSAEAFRRVLEVNLLGPFLLSRAAGSLVTLLFWREQFRPIFGAGPLDAAATGAGAWIQLGATIFAHVMTVPLVLLPLAVLAVELTRDERHADVH